MNTIIYAKYSRERREEFQISTTILEDGEGRRQVEKRALQKAGIPHVEAMAKNSSRLAQNCRYEGLSVCPCTLVGEGTVSFPFIQGKNMDQIITEHVEAGDFQAVREDVSLLYRILSAQNGLAPFEPTEPFREIFGSPDLPEGLTAVPLSNLDMIFSNIMTDGKNYYLTDYEWVFEFPIPIRFLFARSLMLHGALQTLKEEQLRELYALGGVELEELPLYFDMEVRFQKYVTGEEEANVLSKLYPKMKTCCFFLDYWNTEHLYYRAQVWGLPKDGGDPECLHDSQHFQGEVKERVPIPDTDRYRAFLFQPVDTEAVLKIHYFDGIRGGAAEPAAFSSHNAQLNYGQEYYFQQPPRMEIKNEGYEELAFAYIVWHRNDFLIGQGIDFRIENERLHRELRKYTGRLHNRVIRKIGSLIKGK